LLQSAPLVGSHDTSVEIRSTGTARQCHPAGRVAGRAILVHNTTSVITTHYGSLIVQCKTGRRSAVQRCE